MAFKLCLIAFCLSRIAARRILLLSQPLACYQCVSEVAEAAYARPKCEDYWKWTAADRKNFNFSCPRHHGAFCVKQITTSVDGLRHTQRGCHPNRLRDGRLLAEGCFRMTGYILTCLCKSNNCNSSTRTRSVSSALVLTLLMCFVVVIGHL